MEIENCLIVVKIIPEYKKKGLIFFKKHSFTISVIFTFGFGVKYDPRQILCDLPMKKIAANIVKCRIIITLCAGTKSLQRWTCPKDMCPVCVHA